MQLRRYSPGLQSDIIARMDMFLPVGGRVAANVHAGQGGVDVAGADQAGGDAEVDVGDGDAGGSRPC